MQDDGKEHFYLNLSTDTAGQRAFVTDSKQPEVLVVNLKDGSVMQKIAAPASLAVLFNPARNEAYVTHREAGKVSVIDAKTYKVTRPTIPRFTRTARRCLRTVNAVRNGETEINPSAGSDPA